MFDNNQNFDHEEHTNDSDTYVESRTVGMGERVGGSIGGAITGFFLFLGSFGLLYWNEGRVDLGEVAKKSVGIESRQVEPAHSGKFVAAHGELKAGGQPLGDPELLRVTGPFLRLVRDVEMFAWVEKKETRREGDKEKTIYNYIMDWSDNPPNSQNFHVERARHENSNPPMRLKDLDLRAKTATLGAYGVDLQGLFLPTGENLVLNPSDLAIGRFPAAFIDGNQVIVPIGRRRTSRPEVGDLRVKYRVLQGPLAGVLFARLDGSTLSSYSDPATNEALFRFFANQNREQAIASLKGEHKTTTWILRVVGFLMMWFGLSMFFGPISHFLGAIPLIGGFAGGVSGFVIGLLCFLVAVVLTPVTILISMMLHNIVVIMIVAAGVLALTGVLVAVAGKMTAARA